MVPTSHMPEVRELDACLAATGKQDKEAFARLYTLAAPAVYSYALSILKHPAEAEDALQDTFLKLRSAAHLYEPQGKPMAWILTITRNICLMKLRQQRHLYALSPEELREEADFSPIQDLDDRLVLRTALQTLSDTECQIVVLHAVTGWKHREIAGMLQLPVSTVLSKYQRGLKKLRTELEGAR